jgi:2-iminobutanoate/2-iminopropanoate deaminase
VRPRSVIDIGYWVNPRCSDRRVRRKDFFKNGNFPGSALITVTNFARPGIEIEIQAVGVVGDTCSTENPCSAEGKAKKAQTK